MTSVIVLLPLGTLTAQRLANPSSYPVSAADTSASAGGVSKRRLLSRGTRGSAIPDSPLQPNGTTGVISQVSSAASSPVESEKPRAYPMDNIDAELARIDGREGDADLEQGVRMTRSIQRSVERIRDVDTTGGADSRGAS